MKLMKTILITFLFLSISFMPACRKKSDSDTITADEKETEAKIENLLIGCQITISELDSSLQHESDIVKLDNTLVAFSESVLIAARKRGVLLDNNKIVTTLNIYIKKEGQVAHDTYVALFDGNAKNLLSSILMSSYLSVLSVLKNKSDNSLIDIDALVREQGKPADKIQKFQVRVENDTITLQ